MQIYLLLDNQIEVGCFLTYLNYLTGFQPIRPSPILGVIMTKSQFDDIQ